MRPPTGVQARPVATPGRRRRLNSSELLQIQFSNSLFGGYYVKSQLNDPMTKELEASVKRCSGLYAAYINTGEYE